MKTITAAIKTELAKMIEMEIITMEMNKINEMKMETVETEGTIETEVTTMVVMTQEERKQLIIQSIKNKLKNKMKQIKSSDNTMNNILYSISDEAERNFLKILDYCKEQFEYQCYDFELETTIFIPNILRIKNDTFYIFKFSDPYRNKQNIITEFIQKYPHIRLKQITLKQYRRIIKWFQDDILFESEKYKVNFSLDNRRIIKCNFCGKKFVTTSKKDKYCSDECAKKAQNKPHKFTLRKYYFGYYMDIHHYVRSGWEHNIARILQWCQLDYDYECTTFKLSNGTVYIPDFYVYADDTYYEVKGEIRTNTLTKYNMFKEEYPDKKLIIIDGKIYNDLLQQFPNINFNLHVSVRKNKFNNNRINNVTKYRHDQIYYHEWELNYEFYTNKRINNETNSQIFIHLSKQVQDTLNLSYYQIMHLVKIGQIEYMMQDQQYLFNIKQVKSSIENTNKNDDDILDLLNTENNFFNNKNLHITRMTDINSLDINSADKNILIILQYLNFEIYYEHNIFDLKNDWLVSKIYLPFDQYYYFCRFDYDSDLQNKIMYKLNKSDVKYHVISKQEYYELIRRFSFLFNDSSLISEALNAEKINNNNTKEELHCLYCHQLIDKRKMKNSYKPKFCSRKCHYLYEQEKNETHTFCLNCNKKIVVKNSREINYHQFCSDACALEYKDKTDQQLINSDSLTSTASSKLSFQVGICKNCNKQFYYVGNHEKHFCSENCRLIYHQKVHERQCAVCKKTFMTKDHSQTCCSIECVRILQHQYGKQQLLEKNKLTINNLKRIIITKPADINNIPSKNARILATLLLSQFNQPLEYENHTVRLNDTLIICQFYSVYNGKFYFVKNDVRHQREKINQYMETNPDHKFVLIDQKILQIALKTNKLVLNTELNNYYSFKEALNLFNTSTTLLEQRLRRHNIPVFIDELFSTKLILKENVDKLLQ